MENGFDLAVGAFGVGVVKHISVHIVGNLQVSQVAKLVALGEVIHRDDVGQSACIEAFDEVGANKTGSAGDNDSGHANNSS